MCCTFIFILRIVLHINNNLQNVTKYLKEQFITWKAGGYITKKVLPKKAVTSNWHILQRYTHIHHCPYFSCSNLNLWKHLKEPMVIEWYWGASLLHGLLKSNSTSYAVPGTVLCSGDTTVSERNMAFVTMKHLIECRDKQLHQEIHNYKMRSAKPNKYRVLRKPINGEPDLVLCQGRSPWANNISFEIRVSQRKREEAWWCEDIPGRGHRKCLT